jgi:cellulose synthase/poly-beta-1,6-N-acetylglucosamine synthase-like glycosyltransferase
VFFVELLYLISALLLAIYGLNSLVLTWLYRRRDLMPEPGPAGQIEPAWYPPITIQLPVYNERHVVERLIEATLNLAWPPEQLQIQILDDSSDNTCHIIAEALRRHRANGSQVRIEHIRRPERRGFKAGALAYGLTSATGDFVAIFDADFIPPADFLRQTVPYFRDATVGCVQTRWGHVNPDSSPLTRAQALGIDGHFIVEQMARHTIKAFLNFNGTAGIWRRSCMSDAGGWQGDTLTEDLDLSYRAQFRGWRIFYQAETVVPAELPVQIQAFKRQQFRWAKGSIQTALKLLPQLWQTPRPLWLKVMGTLHLTNYSVHPFMLLNLLTTFPMTMSNSPFLWLTPIFVFSAIGPPLLYWTAMPANQRPIMSRAGRLGLLIALGTGLSLNNSRAALEALIGLESEFKRTPKFAVTGRGAAWQKSSYALPRDLASWLEVLLAVYAVALFAWVISQGIWWLIPWLTLYASGYSYVAGLGLLQAWQQARAVRQGAVT